MLLPASLLLLVFLSMLASLLCSCVPATLGVLDVLVSALSVVPAFQAPLLLLTPYCCKYPCYCQLVMNAGFPADAWPAADVPAISNSLWMLASQLMLDLLLLAFRLIVMSPLWLASMPLFEFLLFLVSLLTKKIHICFLLLADYFRTDQFFAVGLYLGVWA
jgi:hypothetical protein